MHSRSQVKKAAHAAAQTAQGPLNHTSIRTATKKAQGSSKNSKSSESKRLGVKLFGGQACQPGSIIIRQRGTKWRPADNVGMGKDHTIYSLTHGKVLFSKCPLTKKTQVGVAPYEFPTVKPLASSVAQAAAAL